MKKSEWKRQNEKTDRNAKMFDLRYRQGKSLSEISEEFGISRQRVNFITRKIFRLNKGLVTTVVE